jgi:hypothetical protein
VFSELVARIASILTGRRSERRRSTDPALEELRAFVAQAMRDYVAAHPEDGYAAQSYPYDVERLATSLQWIGDLGVEGDHVLELGKVHAR